MILLKHFQKVSSDGKTTQLKHKDGHTINIAHGALSPKMRKQLDELPNYSDGGTAGLHENYSQDMKRQEAEESYTGKKTRPSESEQEYQQRRKQFGPSTPRLTMPAGMADGGTTSNEDVRKAMLNSNEAEDPMALLQPQDQMNSYGLPTMQPQSSQSNAQSEVSSEPPPSNMPLQTSKPTMQQQQNPIAQSMGNQADVLQKSLGQMEQGQKAEATAIGAQGKQEAQAARQQQASDQSLMDHYNAKSQEIDSERMAVYNDLKAGHIEPNHYLQSMSGFGQAMTAIGLALGGYGAGINGGPNTAMEFLNKQIDRDVEAQKAEMGKKNNLLSHLQQQFGNLRDATTMAKAIQRDLYSAKMEEAAAASKDPIAQSRAQQTIGEWHMKYEPEIQKMKMNQALLSGAKNGQVSPEILVQHSPLVPEHQRPEMAKQLGKLRALEDLRSNMHDSFEQIGNKFMNGLLSPKDVNSAKQIYAGKLVQLSEGRYNFEAAMNMVDAAFQSPWETSATSGNKLKRIDNLIDSMAAEPKSMLSGVGIELPKPVEFKSLNVPNISKRVK